VQIDTLPRLQVPGQALRPHRAGTDSPAGEGTGLRGMEEAAAGGGGLLPGRSRRCPQT
jgi:hypothetical protein